MGWVPFMPGTAGSIAAFVVWWFAIASLSVYVQVVAAVVLLLIGSLVLEIVVRRYGDHDASSIVIDEMAGSWIALLLLPQIWQIFLIAFALFRLFDIWKPFPVGWIDKNVKGSIGIWLDDIVAGGMVCIIAHAIYELGVFG